MKRDKFILILFLTLFFACNTSDSNANTEIEKEIQALTSIAAKQAYLEQILEDDQKVRGSKGQELTLQYGENSKEYMEYTEALWQQDAINLNKVDAYLKAYGYPKKDEVGDNAVIAPWAVIHHQTDVAIRNSYFEQLYKAYLSGDINDTVMSLYLGRTYDFTFKKRFEMKSPFKSEDEINQLIEQLGLQEKKMSVQ